MRRARPEVLDAIDGGDRDVLEVDALQELQRNLGARAAARPHFLVEVGLRADGQWQVLAVNHGGRESVEFFQLLEESEGYRLAWRGCALAPPDSTPWEM